MSILLIEGFESGLELPFAQFDGSGFSVVATDPRTGTYHASVAVGASNTTLHGFSTTVDNDDGDRLIVGFAYKTAAVNSAHPSTLRFPICHLSEPGRSDGLFVGVNSSGYLWIGHSSTNNYDDYNVTIHGQAASFPIAADTWHYIEIESFLNDSTGNTIVLIDGNEVINYSGDTRIGFSGTHTNTRELRFFGGPANGGSAHLFDDIYALSDDGVGAVAALGPVSIEMLAPTSQTTGQFVGSDADSVDNHLLVDERPVSSADYVESNTSGERDLYGFSNRTLTGDVLAVAPVAYALNPDTGTVAIDLVVSSNATEDQSDPVSLSGSESVATNILELDPDTAAAWTTSGVNAALAGFEVG